MRINIHSLVFKQCLQIMLGIVIVFSVIFFVLRGQIADRFTDVVVQQGRQININNGSKINEIFADSVEVADYIVELLEEEQPGCEELPEFLSELLILAREDRAEITAIVVAYEPKVADGSDECMVISKYSDDDIKTIYGHNYTDESWYTDPKLLRKGVWCEPFMGAFVKETVAVYSIPFFHTNEQGRKEFAGVVCVDLSLAFLKDALDELPLNSSGYGFILSNSGRIVAHPNEAWVFNESLESLSHNGHPELINFAHDIKQKKSGVFIGNTFQGDKAYMYYDQMNSNGWTFGLVFRAHDLLAQQSEFDIVFLTIGFIGVTLMLIMVFIVSDRVSKPLKSLAAVAEDIGKGNFNVAIPPIKSNDEIGMFAKAFNQMRISLAEHIEDLKKMNSAKEKIESELQVAQEIQMGILPKILPPFPKCEYFEIDAFLTPAKEVGGDLYDFFMLSPTKICIVIGDVSGKGVPASLFMAVTQTLHRGLAHEQDLDPQIIVTKMNKALCNNNSANLFVTYVLGVLDLESGVMVYCNAGHNPFYILKSDGTVTSPAERHGIPLGLRAKRPYGKSELKLEAGDTLFMYTDGIPEAKDDKGEFFGEERLETILKHAAKQQLTPKDLDDSLQAGLAKFVNTAEQFDDITVVTLRLLKLANR